MTNTCAHCGIPAPFYETGFLIARSSRIQLLKKYNPVQMDDRTAIFAYDNLNVAAALAEAAAAMEITDLKLGLSHTPRISRLYDARMMATRLTERATVEFIQSGNMVSYLQPIINMKTKSLFGFEALLRAKNPDEFISPAQLFETAAGTGLSSLLDQRAREVAIESRQGVVEAGTKSFINFLPSTIYNPDFCLQHTFEIAARHRVDPADLVFEVVETEKIQDIGHLKTVLDRYRKEGMKVALDDVGSGFATLDMLELLQPDYIKIDRSFISDCHLDMRKQEFLQKTQEYARQLGILTLAEGIESEEEFQVCSKLDYDFAQGYHIGKPAPGKSFAISTSESSAI